MIWLARTFTERGQFDLASLMFDKIDNNANLPKSLVEDIEAARAQYSIETKKVVSQGISNIEERIIQIK